MNSIIKKTIDSYEIDHKNTTLFLDTFLSELVSTYDFIEAGYIGIISHNMWIIHSKENVDFSEILKTQESASPYGIPVFSSITSVCSYQDSFYEVKTMNDFYMDLPQETLAILKKIHSPWSKFLIVPLMVKSQMMGHIVLNMTNRTTKEQIQNLSEPLEIGAKLLASYLKNLILEDHNESLGAILKTSISIASTYRLTGYIHKTFLSTLLKLAINLIPEADYGASIIIDNGLWIFDDAIGHDIKGLRAIPITKDLYEMNMILTEKNNQVDHNVYIIDNILWDSPSDNQQMKIIREKIRKTSQPIKTSLQVQIMTRGILKGLITLDISPNNPLQFSNKSVQIIKQIGHIGAMFFSYNTIYGYTESFNRLTKLISDFSSYGNIEDNQFMHYFLELMIQGIPEANYASIYIRNNGKIHYIDAIGHNVSILKSLDIDESYFEDANLIKSDSETISPFSIYRNVQEFSSNRMPANIRSRYLNAVRPVKESMMCHFLLKKDTTLDIAIDISKESLLSFTNESIIMFQSYSNIGFAFMAKKFFSDEIEQLNVSIEEHEAHEAHLITQNQTLTHRTHLDELTNLYNHTYTVSLLEKAIIEYRDKSLPLTIILFDIDFFKEVNDTHGHVTGDHVLMSIASIIKNGHPNQYAGRYGGEEFLTILPNTTLNEASDYATYIRRQIESTVFDKELSLTISGGVTQWDGESTTDFIRKADQLLYTAKSKGRNRIEIKL